MKLEFTTFDISKTNYLWWVIDTEIHNPEAMNLEKINKKITYFYRIAQI